MTERQPENVAVDAPYEDAPTGACHFAEFVPLPGYGGVFRFMRLHMRLYKAAVSAPGYVAGGIRAKWWRKQFWTYWVWDSRDALHAFLSAHGPASLKREMRSLAGPGACNVEWASTEAPSWEEALRRLREPSNYLVPPSGGLR